MAWNLSQDIIFQVTVSDNFRSSYSKLQVKQCLSYAFLYNFDKSLLVNF